MISHRKVLCLQQIVHMLGEQVFISYGKKSNGELLLSYGFVPKEGTNPSDSVELPLSLNRSDKCYSEKLKALQKHGLSGTQCFPIRVTGWPVELIAYAYLVVSPPSMEQEFEKIAAAASNNSQAKKDIRYPELEEKALQFLLDSCEFSISKYSKLLQESGSMDLDVTSPKQLNRRLFLKQLSVDLCTSERRILYRIQNDDFEPPPDKLLPDISPLLQRRLTLVLDMNETLVHSDWMEKEITRDEHSFKRPGLDAFLDRLYGCCELVIYTDERSMDVNYLIFELEKQDVSRWKTLQRPIGVK